MSSHRFIANNMKYNSMEDLKESVDLVANGVVKTVVASTVPLEEFEKGIQSIKDCYYIGKAVCTP
jgi:D-arabinose 1-dehydrogenase-like Zn-dependent alcohol dehydrogenase